MKVCLITATKDRHSHLERVVRFVLNQTYNNIVHLIFNNSKYPMRLNKNLPEDKFILINSPFNSHTKHSYKTLGEIYNDAIKYVPQDCDVISFMDDDDIYLPDHVEEGVKGLQKGGKLAYKPKKSWYRHMQKIHLVENVMEPSIFIMTSHILEHGFGDETTAQHHKWITPLIQQDQMFVDEDGKPTYICDWSQELKTFKTSGDPNNPNNFQNYESHTKDYGDGIITPCSETLAKHYYRTK